MAAFGGFRENGEDGMSSVSSDLAPWFIASSNDHNSGKVIQRAMDLGLIDLAGSLSQVPPSDGDVFQISVEFVDEIGREVKSETWDARFIDGIRLTVWHGGSVLTATLGRDGEVAVVPPSMCTLDLIQGRPAEEAIANIPNVLRELPLSARHHAFLEYLPDPVEFAINGTDIRAIPVGCFGSRAVGF